MINFKTLLRPLLFYFIFNALSINTLIGQDAELPKALKYFEKGKHEGAFKYLEKLVEKDTINPEFHYSYSLIQLIDSLPYFNVDSSYLNINKAIKDFKSISEEREQQKLIKQGIELTAFNTQKNKVEKMAFKITLNKNTEEDYNYFIHNYGKNIWLDSAITLRNKAAFRIALEENSYGSYRKFMETYPNAMEISEARVRFERLYFDESTKDHKLSSFVNFLEDHPNTHYRELAERQILELSTFSGEPENILSFINSYPKSIWKKLAVNFLYHIDPQLLNQYSDSLKMIQLKQNISVFPFYKFGNFGFRSIDGEELIAPKFSQIANEYKCETTDADYLIVENEDYQLIVNKIGETIWERDFDEIEDIGSGLLSIKDGENLILLHKSGYIIKEGRYELAKLLNNKLISLKHKNGWQLFSLFGRQLLNSSFDEIENENDFIIFKKGDKYAITTIKEIAKSNEDKVVDLQFQYSDYLLVNKLNLIVNKDNSANIIDGNLKLLLPEITQEIIELKNGYAIKKNNQYSLYSNNLIERDTLPFDKFVYNNFSFFVSNNNKWIKLGEESTQYDSAIILSDNISLGLGLDSITFFIGNSKIKKHVESTFRIIKDNSYTNEKEEYLVFTKETFVEVYNLQGVKIYSGNIEKINALGPNLIVLQLNGKKGVINSKGKQIIPNKMDAIANYQGGTFSVLSNSKFGVSSKNGKLIPPTYNRSLKVYDDNYFIAYKNNHYGLINDKNEPVTEMRFDEIQYWNDSAALVKINFLWKVYHLASKKFIHENIIELQPIKEADNESIYKILIDNQYGILSTKRGMIVPASYNDIINIGTKENPLYMAERNIEEADFYVTIYYNEQGEIIYKQAYESVDYQKMLCE